MLIQIHSRLPKLLNRPFDSWVAWSSWAQNLKFLLLTAVQVPHKSGSASRDWGVRCQNFPVKLFEALADATPTRTLHSQTDNCNVAG